MSTYKKLHTKTLKVKNFNEYIKISQEIDLIFNQLSLEQYSTLVKNLINNL